MPSSIPAARLNLFTALTVAPALTDWQVTFGPPEAHSEERKVLSLLSVESVATEHAELGGSGGQEESYSILLRGKVHDPSCNGDPAELQAIDQELWGVGYETVRQVVKWDQTLGGVITISSIVATAEPGRSEESPVPAVNDDGTAWGWVAFADWRVECRTRIT